MYGEYYHEFWKIRCTVLHEPKVQRKVFKDEMLEIIEEVSEEEVSKEEEEWLRRHVEVHRISVNEISVKEIL